MDIWKQAMRTVGSMPSYGSISVLFLQVSRTVKPTVQSQDIRPDEYRGECCGDSAQSYVLVQFTTGR